MNWIGLIADTLMSSSISLALLTGLSHALKLQSVLDILGASLLTYLVLRMKSVRLRLAVVTLISITLVGWSYLTFHSNGAFSITIGWMFTLLRRVTYIRHAHEHEFQMRRLIVDVCFGLPTLAVVSLYSQGIPPSAWSLASGLFAVAIMARVGALRQAQMERAKEEGVDYVPLMRGLFLGIAGGVAVAIWAFFALPGFRWGVFALLGLVLFLPLVQTLKQEWPKLVGMAVIPILYYLLKGRRTPTGVHLSGGIGNMGKLKVHPVHHSSLATVWLYVAFGLLVVGFIIYYIWKQKQPDGPEPPIVASTVHIARSRIRPELPGVTSSTPLRQLVMQILAAFASQGQPIDSGQTLRQFIHQRKDETGLLRQLCHRYEKERYGGQVASQAEVMEIQNRLRALGFFQPRAHNRLKLDRTDSSLSKKDLKGK